MFAVAVPARWHQSGSVQAMSSGPLSILIPRCSCGGRPPPFAVAGGAVSGAAVLYVIAAVLGVELLCKARFLVKE
jgi:hypothetical protein